MSALQGTLNRTESGWKWSDGTAAEGVYDMTASWHYNFRCRTYGCGTTYIEVPLNTARQEPDLGWVWRGYCDKKYEDGLSGDHKGERVLRIDEEYAEGDIAGISDPEIKVSHIGHVRADGGKRAIPRVALVPASEWDAWSQANPIGVRWDKIDEAKIMEKARSLGYRG